jgi:hypothetical protein
MERKTTDIEIKVFVSAACHDGKCEECKGIYERDKHPDDWLFCTHECHTVKNRGN